MPPLCYEEYEIKQIKKKRKTLKKEETQFEMKQRIKSSLKIIIITIIIINYILNL